MKIGVDIRNIGKRRTGDEVVFFNLTKELARIDRSNEYFLFTDTTENKVLESIEERLEIGNKKNFKVISLAKSGKKSINKFIWNMWSLPNHLRKNPVDIYHTQYITPFFISKKIKIVSHIHDVSFKAYSKFIKWSDLFFLNILIPLSLKRADIIIAVSEFTKNEIVEHYNINPEKIDIIYNSTDLGESDILQKEKIKDNYNLPEKFILYVGTLQPRKNIPILIEAYAETKEKFPEIKLVIGGDKKSHNFDRKIDKAMNKYKLSDDHVVFCGYIDTVDKFTLYSMAHVVANPSFYEGFGIVPLEAMRARVPILVSDISPHREVAGDAALYFDPRSLDDLKKKLYNICVDENLRKRLIGLESARANFFSWKKSAEKLLGIYESLK